MSIHIPGKKFGALLDSAEDWTWFRCNESNCPATPSDQFIKAEDAIVDLLQSLIDAGVPHDFVYSPIDFTKNIIIPTVVADVYGVREIFADAAYKDTPIPELTDAQSSKDLRDAILAGSDMNTTWH